MKKTMGADQNIPHEIPDPATILDGTLMPLDAGLFFFSEQNVQLQSQLQHVWSKIIPVQIHVIQNVPKHWSTDLIQSQLTSFLHQGGGFPLC